MTAGRIAQAVLLADIGGTNARFALLSGGEIGDVQHLRGQRLSDLRGGDGGLSARSRR